MKHLLSFFRGISEKQLHFFSNIIERVERLEEFDHFSSSIQQKLWKVKRNHLWHFFFFVKEITVVSEPAIDGVSIWSIDFHLFEHGEISSEFTPHKLPNLVVAAGLLIEECIGREGQHLKTFVPEFIVHLCEAFVVEWGQRSFGCHIDNNESFLPMINIELDKFSLDVLGL